MVSWAIAYTVTGPRYRSLGLQAHAPVSDIARWYGVRTATGSAFCTGAGLEPFISGVTRRADRAVLYATASAFPAVSGGVPYDAPLRECSPGGSYGTASRVHPSRPAVFP